MAYIRLLWLFFVMLVAALIGTSRPGTGQGAGTEPATTEGDTTMATATFAAGCFWGVEETFRNVKGVTETTVGYTGGWTENPTYPQVCTHTTGHAEAVLVQYDPEQVSYEELLGVFWGCHDPTTLNRQGPDVGSQYRSAVFYHTADQQQAAEAAKRRLEASGAFGGRPIVTQILPAATFWRAEDYHQRYLEKRGLSSCQTP